RAAKLEIDILDAWVVLEDAEDIADPGDLLRVRRVLVNDLVTGPMPGPERATVAGVVDDEVQVGPVLRRLRQVVWRARLLIERAKRKSLVDAQVLHAEFLGTLPKRVGALLVIHEPRLLAQFGPGVHLPGVDFEFLHLPLHLGEFLFTKVRP